MVQTEDERSWYLKLPSQWGERGFDQHILDLQPLVYVRFLLWLPFTTKSYVTFTLFAGMNFKKTTFLQKNLLRSVVNRLQVPSFPARGYRASLCRSASKKSGRILGWRLVTWCCKTGFQLGAKNDTRSFGKLLLKGWPFSRKTREKHTAIHKTTEFLFGGWVKIMRSRGGGC